MADRIAPPADAPLPWKRSEHNPDVVVSADGGDVGWFGFQDIGDYAILAANALPGLVAFVETFVRWVDSDYSADVTTGPAIVHDARAALAALPKEPTP